MTLGLFSPRMLRLFPHTINPPMLRNHLFVSQELRQRTRWAEVPHSQSRAITEEKRHTVNTCY